MPASNRARSRVVVLGWYGSNNTGDEAVLEATVGALRERGLTDLFVFSTDPARTSERLGLPSHYRRLDLASLQAMRGARALVLGGGGLIQDGTSVYNLPIYTLFVLVARLMGLKVVGWGLGVEPLWTLFGRLQARLICAVSEHFSVRDTMSKWLLMRAGVPVDRVRVTADPAFLITPGTVPVQDVGDGRPLVAFCVRQLSDNHPGLNLHYLLPVGLRQRLGVGWRPPPERAERFVHALARSIKLCWEELGARVELLPLWPGRDDAMLVAITHEAERLGVPGEAISIAHVEHTPSSAATYLAGADAVVSMRLHALIFAVSAGVPVLALTYARKVKGLMIMLGLRRWTIEVDKRTPPPEEIEMKLRHLWADRARVSQQISRAAEEARLRALADADTIAVTVWTRS